MVGVDSMAKLKNSDVLLEYLLVMSAEINKVTCGERVVRSGFHL